MNFIVDAHLPRVIANYIKDLDHEATHTSYLEFGNNTPDTIINEIAVLNNSVTKDTDFYNSFLLKKQPSKLVLVKIGNMRLTATKKLFKKYLPLIITTLETHDLVEIYSDKIVGIEV